MTARQLNVFETGMFTEHSDKLKVKKINYMSFNLYDFK